MPVYRTTTTIAFLLLAAILVACGSATPSADNIETDTAVEAPYNGSKILVVDSYHIGDGATDEIQAAIDAALADSGVEIEYVYLDTKRNQDDEFGEQAAQDALARIEEFQPDVLIAPQDNVQELLVVPHLTGADIPVIFNGVNWDASVYGYPTDNVTGVVEVDLVDQVISLLGEYTDGDRIGYLAGNSNTERRTTAIYQERFFDGSLDINLVDTYADYQEAFLRLQNEADILLLGNHAGIEGWPEDDAQTFFEENTTIPTGGLRARTAPFALLTLAKINAEQGKLAVELLMQVLDGTPVADIPLTENKEGDLYLNLTVAENLDITFTPALLRNAQVFGGE